VLCFVDCGTEVDVAHKFLAILTFPFVFAGSPGASATDRGAPAPVARIGGTEKICQLTGERDWETGEPTSARTFTNFGLDAADLGYPIEHAGKLILLFGDSWPPRHPGGAAGEIPPDDAVGVVTRREPPGSDGKCLEMRIHHRLGPRPIFAPATVIGPTPTLANVLKPTIATVSARA
jgi:hypothetical protein